MSNNNSPLLGTIAGIIGLITAALYFTGWIYRWAYFGFFQLEVTTLDLPFESFLIVPLQVFFGSFASASSLWQLSRTILIAIGTFILIQSTLWLLKKLSLILTRLLNFLVKIATLSVISLISLSIKFIKKIYDFLKRRRANSKIIWIFQKSISFAESMLSKLRSIQFKPLNFQQSILDESIIVIGILISLFLLAKAQGVTDAMRDACNKTSALPVVTFVNLENQLPLGRQFSSPEALANKSPANNFRMIGDPGLINQLRTQELNDLKTARVWRLLIERDGWIYLFRTLPANPSNPLQCPWNPNSNQSAALQRPLVLVIRESDKSDQLMILSPQTSKPAQK